MKNQWKRWMAVLLAAALLALALPLSAGATVFFFDDVDEDAWYTDAVVYVYYSGLMEGVGGSKFAPKEAMTRAMFLQVLYNLTEHPEDEGENNNVISSNWLGFSDVSPVAWYEEAANWAYYVGLTEGMGGNKFAPAKPVSREEIAQFLYRYAQITGNEIAATDKDADISLEDVSPWAREAMLWARNAGIIQGDDAGKLWPKKVATRAEVAQMLQRIVPQLEQRKTARKPRASKLGESLGLTGENYPRVNGSTSTLALTQEAYGATHQYWAADAPLEAVRTVPSYEKLIAGDLDLILVPYASQDVLDLAEAQGVELEFHKLALEALVFITRQDNPTENITEDQVRDIYLDYAIKSWKDLGGPEMELIPLCRNAASGSQSQLDNLILQGEPMHPDIEQNFTELTMPGMLFQTAYFRKDDEPPTAEKDYFALGYTLFAYLENYGDDPTGAKDALKMLSYNGVAPTVETVKDGSYSLVDGYYAVLQKDTPEGAPARKLLKWMQGEDFAARMSGRGFLPAN